MDECRMRANSVRKQQTEYTQARTSIKSTEYSQTLTQTLCVWCMVNGARRFGGHNHYKNSASALDARLPSTLTSI